jgi:hypothetical protein
MFSNFAILPPLVDVLGVLKKCNFVTFFVLLGLISSPIPAGPEPEEINKFWKATWHWAELS